MQLKRRKRKKNSENTHATIGMNMVKDLRTLYRDSAW